VDKIAVAAELGPDDLVIEIGPGLGILTKSCARLARQVVAVEIDHSLFPLLEEVLAGYQNVHLEAGDARTVNFDSLADHFQSDSTNSYKVVGNLPYYITSPLIMRLLSGGFRVELLVFMVQKEVAQRIVAGPGGKDYGALSVAVQYYSEPEIIFTLKPHAFYPPPDVESAVVRFRLRHRPPVRVDDQKLFFQVVHAAFRYRRKTIRNSLLQAGLLASQSADTVFAEAGISPKRRGETFTLSDFAELTQAIYKAGERKVATDALHQSN
jgi:16S rRNA (adenine1518-N6/adenine1519-N6)-dimethyltransferase